MSDYGWTAGAELPPMLTWALALQGDFELLAWAEELGLDPALLRGADPAGIWLAVVVQRAGEEVVNDPRAAKRWIRFGRDLAADEEAHMGDVVIFEFGAGLAAGVILGHDMNAYHVVTATGIARVFDAAVLAVRVQMADELTVAYRLRADGTLAE